MISLFAHASSLLGRRTIKLSFRTKRIQVITLTLSFIGVVMLLLPIIRGDVDPASGTLRYQNRDYSTQPLSPYESSGSSARYATTESIVRNGQFHFTPEQKSYASPDITLIQGKYSSLFTPGIAFLAVPFYFVGSLFSVPQIGAYSLNIAAAFVCFLLIYKLVRGFGASRWLAYLSGFIFVFGTNALVYASSLTQHLVSTALLLLLIILARAERTPLRLLLVGLIYGFGVVVDIPNLFLMLPSLLYILYQTFGDGIYSLKEKTNRLVVLRSVFLLAIGISISLGLFISHNIQLTGSPFTIAQLVGRPPETLSLKAQAEYMKSSGKPRTLGELSPFQTRNMSQGFFLFATSDERSFLYYSPIVLVGIIGLILLYRQSQSRALLILLVSHAVMNVLIYSMFGDPWGGWAFGPRYLIPTAAICCVGLAFMFPKNRLLTYLVAAVIGYVMIQSISISALGAVTTAQVPPKQEAQALDNPIPHTYEYNKQFIEKNLSSSLLFNSLRKNGVSAQNFYFWYTTTLSVISTGVLVGGLVSHTRIRKAVHTHRKEVVV